MKLINGMLFWYLKTRVNQINQFREEPIATQFELLSKLLLDASQTEFGNTYDFASIDSYETFRNRVPITTYEDFQPYIERARQGEKDVIWPGKIKWFAKSSGTTNDKSKYIPITEQSLQGNHYKAGKDMFALYANEYPDTSIFNNKNLRLGGSSEIYKNYGSVYGDLSAILIDNLPFWAEMKNIPDKKTSLMHEWETKLKAIIAGVKDQNVGSLTGVPSWMMVLLYKILEDTGNAKVDELWPNIEAFFHGGISFKPYRIQYDNLFHKKINYFEIYNASEGFFAIQDVKDSDELLLLLNHGVFYEFVPMEEFEKEQPRAVSIDEVELGKNYAMVITTNGGLWRYLIGDTIKFTSTNPFRIQVTGRTKHFINAFGEELIIENAETALEKAQQETNSLVNEYTAGPIFMEGKEKGGHQWVIEFQKPPSDIQAFADILDKNLQLLNSDYEAKRYKNITLNPLKLTVAPNGFFLDWMKERGKLGGQNKVPRLANNREYLDPILEKLKIVENQ